jgi:hypothetical protein
VLNSRRNHRLDLKATTSDVWMLDRPLTQLRIVNISYGGLCLEMEWPFTPGTECELLLRLKGSIDEAAMVSVAVRWKRLTGRRWHCGAEVLASDQSWLGPAPWYGPACSGFVPAGLRPWYLPGQGRRVRAA